MGIANLARSLAEDRLHLLVFGPGYGESVAVHVPPGDWLICDSFVRGEHASRCNPVASLLHHRDQGAQLLLLTHPHDDHTGGFDELVDQFAVGRVGVVRTQLEAHGFTEDGDAAAVISQSNNMKALAAIHRYWREHPELRWSVCADDPPLKLGAGTVHVLHPDRTFLSHGVPAPAAAPNEYSVPLMVSWEGVRLLLGADLPAVQWQTLIAAPAGQSFADHTALKVPHHGSEAALHSGLFHASNRISATVLTPWNRGRSPLPRLDANGGLSWLLQRRARVAMTAAGHALTAPLAREVSRRDLELSVVNAPLPAGFGQVESRPIADPDESWVAATFTRHGTLEKLQLGSEAHLIGG